MTGQGLGRPGRGRTGRGRTGRGWDAAPPRVPGPTGDAGGEPAEPSDPAELAREICLRQLSVRPRTRTELATELRRRGVADEVAAEVLDRYGEVGIIDDQAFATAWVTSRHHGRGLARRALAGELRRKGVDSEVVDRALDELDAGVEADTARDLVRRKLRGERTGRPDATFRRLVGMLARRGYPAGLAIRVVKEALEECDAADPAGTLEADTIEADAIDAEAAELAEAEARGEAHAAGPDVGG